MTKTAVVALGGNALTRLGQSGTAEEMAGNAAAMAAALGIHPQTARYRIARLRELVDTDLDDPDTRFELELALRTRRA